MADRNCINTQELEHEALRDVVGKPRRELLDPIPFPNKMLESRPSGACVSIIVAMARFYHMPELLTLDLIAAESGLSRSTVSLSMTWLIENKWITKTIDVTDAGITIETRYRVNLLQDGPGFVVENIVGESTDRTKVDGSTVIKVYSRDGFKCAKCASIDHLTIDHIKPLARGGTNDIGNLQTLCRPCNSAKGAKWEGDGK